MADSTRELILEHWQLANERRWDEFERLLDPALIYELPQTREYIESGHGYLELFRTWPGNWIATVRQLICEGAQAACTIDFAVGAEVSTGISFFGVRNGRIASVTDYWPDPYDPPLRMTPLLRRRAG